MKKILNSIKFIEKSVKYPKKGLPDNIFYFVGRMTPFINVDLLIKCPDYGTILTWREDKFTGKGWHIPGGIIRFKEKIEYRIKKTGQSELGVKIKNFKGPIVINEIFANQRDRSHFISMLFQCYLSKKETIRLLEITKSNKNIKFFKTKPKNLLNWHKIYSKFI
jgi:ADP-ribose pyrophosphatase YjhB (NUDIX family)